MGRVISAIKRLFTFCIELPDRRGVRLLSDNPITDPADDYFGFATFATALAEIIDNERTDTPLTVALSAPWGAGKTSVAGMMQTLLRRWVTARDGERARVLCRFNAWEHDGSSSGSAGRRRRKRSPRSWRR